MAIFNSYVSLPEGITFLNTSKRWNMKRSNWLKPEFSAGLLLLDAIWLLFDCCFSPLNNIEMRGNWDHDDHGLHLSEQWCSYDSLVFTAHGWYGMQPLSSRLGFIWTMQCFFFVFFLSRSFINLAWFIWYKCIYTYICPTSRSPTADILTCPRSSQR